MKLEKIFDAKDGKLIKIDGADFPGFVCGAD